MGNVRDEAYFNCDISCNLTHGVLHAGTYSHFTNDNKKAATKYNTVSSNTGRGATEGDNGNSYYYTGSSETVSPNFMYIKHSDIPSNGTLTPHDAKHKKVAVDLPFVFPMSLSDAFVKEGITGTNKFLANTYNGVSGSLFKTLNADAYAIFAQLSISNSYATDSEKSDIRVLTSDMAYCVITKPMLDDYVMASTNVYKASFYKHQSTNGDTLKFKYPAPYHIENQLSSKTYFNYAPNLTLYKNRRHGGNVIEQIDGNFQDRLISFRNIECYSNDAGDDYVYISYTANVRLSTKPNTSSWATLYAHFDEQDVLSGGVLTRGHKISTENYDFTSKFHPEVSTKGYYKYGTTIDDKIWVDGIVISAAWTEFFYHIKKYELKIEYNVAMLAKFKVTNATSATPTLNLIDATPLNSHFKNIIPNAVDPTSYYTEGNCRDKEFTNAPFIYNRISPLATIFKPALLNVTTSSAVNTTTVATATFMEKPNLSLKLNTISMNKSSNIQNTDQIPNMYLGSVIVNFYNIADASFDKINPVSYIAVGNIQNQECHSVQMISHAGDFYLAVKYGVHNSHHMTDVKVWKLEYNTITYEVTRTEIFSGTKIIDFTMTGVTDGWND